MSTLHVHRFGPASGPLILALHGLTGHGLRWAALSRDHLPEVRILAPDLRGHGRSTSLPPWDFERVVADLTELLEAEADGPVPVVGHSFGGASALHLAHHHPELVRGLVLLDPAIALDPTRLEDIARRTLADPDYADVAAARADKLASSWDEVPADQLEAELAEHLVPTGSGRVGWRVSLPALTSYWGQLARDFVLPPADMPTVLVRATKVDPPFVTPELRAALAERLGDRLTVRDMDCDHMVPQARAAEVAELVRAALR
ncbi:alpha/beta fold hydrolase [Nocardia bovistercoris]|uniref:alpha/beta fold hydrolase n=1 Tax=Nocardia bovistercoris TaxID=2785916 RepID=UPI002FCD0783